LETLLARLGELAADMRARQDDLRRALAEVTDVAQQCRDRLAELPGTS
jgi:ABC-type transporter Mla subunit MlaD